MTMAIFSVLDSFKKCSLSAVPVTRKSPCLPPFSKGEVLKRESTLFTVSTRESRSFESKFPSLEKRGQGRFVEFARGLFNFFTASLFQRGKFFVCDFDPSLEKSLNHASIIHRISDTLH
jgi:hypothetical protein